MLSKHFYIRVIRVIIPFLKNPAIVKSKRNQHFIIKCHFCGRKSRNQSDLIVSSDWLGMLHLSLLSFLTSLLFLFKLHLISFWDGILPNTSLMDYSLSISSSVFIQHITKTEILSQAIKRSLKDTPNLGLSSILLSPFLLMPYKKAMMMT